MGEIVTFVVISTTNVTNNQNLTPTHLVTFVVITTTNVTTTTKVRDKMRIIDGTNQTLKLGVGVALHLICKY